MASSSPASGRISAPSQGESGESQRLTSLGSVLSSCLDLMKINDAVIRKKAVELIGSVPIGTSNAYGRWITSMKAIADSCAIVGHIFTQSETCDFLAVAIRGIDANRAGNKAVSDATFYIYKDIMEHFQQSQNTLKANFARIIVDVVSVLDKGIDTRGETVGVYNIERYWQQRKASILNEDPMVGYSSKPISEELLGLGGPDTGYRDLELVKSLVQITGRNKGALERTLANLSTSDVRKIRGLALNYGKLQRYNRMTSPKEFKKQAEREFGRKLNDNQLQHAINSIRKVKIYIENLLDGKYVPHGTHGINHVKHNLEYGYQLMGLIEPRKRIS